MQVTSARSPGLETVLVVEREVLVRMVVSEFLRSCGYRVVEAANANEAIEILAHSNLPVRIVLGRAAMSRSKESFALSRWIRANKPDLELILAGGIPRMVDAAARLCEAGPAPKSGERDIVLARVQRLMSARGARDRSGVPVGEAASGAAGPAGLFSRQRRRLVAGR